jgi:hypothetical protein
MTVSVLVMAYLPTFPNIPRPYPTSSAPKTTTNAWLLAKVPPAVNPLVGRIILAVLKTPPGSTSQRSQHRQQPRTVVQLLQQHRMVQSTRDSEDQPRQPVLLVKAALEPIQQLSFWILVSCMGSVLSPPAFLLVSHFCFELLFFSVSEHDAKV